MIIHRLIVMPLLAVFMNGSLLAAQRANAPAPKASSAGGQAAKRRVTFDSALLNPASLKATAPETYQVRFTTTQGDFVVKVTRAWAPLGADRFYNLCKHHFYDGASLFRVLPGFVVQFGIHARPEVSKVWRTAAIRDEPVKESNKRSYVSYAMGGPNTRTTQVFINLADKNAQLDAMGFSPFGEVVEGMEVVEKFYNDYGEAASNHQDLIEAQGKAYLDKNFPKLDSIKTTALVLPEGGAPSKAPVKAPSRAPAKNPS